MNLLTFFREAIAILKEAIGVVRGNFLVILQIIILLVMFMMMWFGYRFVDAKLQAITDAVAPDERAAVVINADKDIRIHKLLEESRIENDADRARLYQFHNGQRSVGGIAFVYASVTHEIVGPGVSSEIKSLQRLPASLFTDAVPDWLSKKVRCKQVAELENQAVKDLLKTQAVSFTCSYGVFDESGEDIIGMVVVNYVRREPKQEDIAKIEENMKILSARMHDALVE